MYQDILYEVDNGVARITINRADKYNAFRGITCDELIDAFNRAAGVVRDQDAITASLQFLAIQLLVLLVGFHQHDRSALALVIPCRSCLDSGSRRCLAAEHRRPFQNVAALF